MKGNARHQVIERSVFFHNMVANMPSTAQLFRCGVILTKFLVFKLIRHKKNLDRDIQRSSEGAEVFCVMFWTRMSQVLVQFEEISYSDQTCKPSVGDLSALIVGH